MIDQQFMTFKEDNIMNNTEQQNNNKVDVIWTDKLTEVRYKSQVDFDTKLNFDKMKNVVLSI